MGSSGTISYPYNSIQRDLSKSKLYNSEDKVGFDAVNNDTILETQTLAKHKVGYILN